MFWRVGISACPPPIGSMNLVSEGPVAQKHRWGVIEGSRDLDPNN